MFKTFKGFITLMLTVAIVFTLFPNNSRIVDAANLSKEKILEENKTYSYNLDGDGKKEKLKYTSKYSENSVNVTLYINQKAVYSKKVMDAYYANYRIMDLDSKDKKLDLFLKCMGDSECLEYGAFQRYEKNKIKTFKSIYYGKHIFGSASLYRISGISQIKGDGTFSINADTPIYFSEVGSYFCYVPFIVKNNKITYKKTNTYNLDTYSKQYEYVANKSIILYSKADKSSKIVTTINKNESLNIKRLKVGDILAEYSTDGYAYIEDKKGNKGWIYLPIEKDWDNPMFKEIPGWG